MTIDEIRELLAEELSTNIEVWNDVLNNTSPGNYGCDFWETEIDFKNIFVDIPNKSFTLKKGDFSADLVMGASKGDNSFKEKYYKSFSAKGKFEFKSANEIKITEIDINIDSDIYSE